MDGLAICANNATRFCVLRHCIYISVTYPPEMHPFQVRDGQAVMDESMSVEQAERHPNDRVQAFTSDDGSICVR